VAFFDSHNDITQEHHEACFATRLRRGHETSVRDLITGRPTTVMSALGRVHWEVGGQDRPSGR
jgi:hypothetical protein